jgi:hypothetical protein
MAAAALLWRQLEEVWNPQWPPTIMLLITDAGEDVEDLIHVKQQLGRDCSTCNIPRGALVGLKVGSDGQLEELFQTIVTASHLLVLIIATNHYCLISTNNKLTTVELGDGKASSYVS